MCSGGGLSICIKDSVYIDKGITGTNTKRREGFNRMVKDALDGKIDLILTKSVSRFARNTVDTLTTIRKLKELGVQKTVMLTGDAQAVGERVGAQLGLDEVHAQLLPADKVERVEALLKEKSDKGALVFVGDGINDAPVLARADIGIAMGALGSDAAIEAADVVLMNDKPSKIATAIAISRRTLRIVHENIVFSLAVKLVILVLSALGVTGMWWAVVGDVGVLVLAVLNAMRALRVKDI